MLYRAGTPIFEESPPGESPWGDVIEVRNSDPEPFFVVNLESPIGEIPSTAFPNRLDMNLCADEESISILEEAKINLVTIANNHAGDCVGSDPSNTAQILNDSGIITPGENVEIHYLHLPDQIVSFVSFNTFSKDANTERVLEQLKLAHQKSTLVVLSVHWGIEYQGGPVSTEEKLAREFVDAGADVIWGHHPHVLQRMEWIKSTVDGHQALVMYSLGNLLSDQWMFPDALKTVLVKIEFKPHQIKSIQILPIVMDSSIKKLILTDNAEEILEISNRLNLSGLAMEGVEVRLQPIKQGSH